MNKFSKLLILCIIAASFSGCITKLNVHTLNQKAAEFMAKDDYDSAICRLVSINDLDPSYPETHYNLAIAYIKKEDYVKAIEQLQIAIDLNPDMTDAYYSLGVASEELADKKIETLKTIKDKEQLTQEKQNISDCVKTVFASYEKYAELSPEGYEKEQVMGQFDFLKDKYKDYLKNDEAPSELED